MNRLLVLLLGIFMLGGCAIAYDTIPDFTDKAPQIQKLVVDKSLAETYGIIVAHQDKRGYGEFMNCELSETSGQCSLKGNRGYLYYVIMKPVAPDATEVTFYGADSVGDSYKHLMNNTIAKLTAAPADESSPETPADESE